MWRNPLLIAGSGGIALTITSDTLIGNLHTFLGSPTGQQIVQITVDGADIGDVQITTDFTAGSTFSFICINGGRILGLGGDGGKGADLPSSGQYNSGSKGTRGGDAISSVYDVDVNIDDGYLLGGGGGGGGGAAYTFSTYGFDADWAGGGGGGGQGFNGGAGGARGNFGSPAAQAGNAGDRTQPGTGGDGSLSGANSKGGSGGKWGSAGRTGGSWSVYSGATGLVTFDGIGGVGGEAGNAFFQTGGGASVTFTGAKSEATLRSEGRIKGSTQPGYVLFAGSYSYNVGGAGATTHGFRFETDGDMTDLGATNTQQLGRWVQLSWTDIGDDHEVRAVGTTAGYGDTKDGTWDSEAAADNTWIDITVARTWSFTHSGPGTRTTGQLFEIRRNDVPGNPDDEILGAYWLATRDDEGV